MADEIASRGYRVTLIEEDSYAGKSAVCGGVTPKESADAFEIPAQVIERTISKWVCYFPKETFSFDIPFVSFQRCIFDRFLSDRASSHGAQLLTNTKALDVSINDEGAFIKLRDTLNQRDYEIKSQIVIFADGAASIGTRKFKGVGFRRRPERTFHGLLYELEWKNNPLDTFDFYFDDKIAPWGYGWVFPKGDLINAGICGLMSMYHSDGGAKMRQRLDYFVREHKGPSQQLAGRKIASVQAAIIPVEPGRKIYGNRMMFVGDAAGMVEPFSAGGMEYAMRAAKMAGQTAVAALKEKDCREASLSRYQTAWKKSKDAKTLGDMQNLMKLGLIYRRFDKKASIKVYSYLFHKVAQQVSKGNQEVAPSIGAG